MKYGVILGSLLVIICTLANGHNFLTVSGVSQSNPTGAAVQQMIEAVSK